jgi:hypothetical protein
VQRLFRVVKKAKLSDTCYSVAGDPGNVVSDRRYNPTGHQIVMTLNFFWSERPHFNRFCATRLPMIVIICVSALLIAYTARSQEAEKPNYSRPVIREIQLMLESLHYRSGPIDGTWGEMTIAAVKKFQKDRGKPLSGVLSRADIADLRVLVGDRRFDRLSKYLSGILVFLQFRKVEHLFVARNWIKIAPMTI